MRNPKSRIPLERKIEELNQYDYFEHDYIFKNHEKYARPIGMFFIAFSRLEVFLDRMIIVVINERGDELGLKIIKYLEFNQKINLAADLYRRIINLIENTKDKVAKTDKLGVIFNKLVEISEFRNKIAHANWITLNKEGFVRVETKESKNSGSINFKYIKVTPLVIRKFIRQTDSLVRIISNLTEDITKN